LEAKVSGSIQEMPIVLGQTVKTDDLIARLHAPEVLARLEQARANLQQNEKDWKRISALFEQQAVTRSEYDAADAKYQLAKAAVAEAQAMVGYMEVRAPFNGVITRKSADVGDLATQGRPLAALEDPSALQIEADVPEANAARIQRGARLPIHVDGISDEISGTVSEIAPSADPQSRTFRVKLDLPSTPSLMPGRFARLMVPLGENDSMFVPGSAVVQRGQLEIAFVVSNQHARMRLVKTGKRLGEEVEILSGLDDGDSVVIEGTTQLVDGQAVTLK
jgi:RND family efflux transporter MFP subunit